MSAILNAIEMNSVFGEVRNLSRIPSYEIQCYRAIELKTAPQFVIDPRT